MSGARCSAGQVGSEAASAVDLVERGPGALLTEFLDGIGSGAREFTALASRADHGLAWRGSLLVPMRTYLYLTAAIVAEVIATTALARSESFARLGPSLVALVGYAAAFWFLSFPLRTMPTGVVYAIWSGLGIVLITAVAWVWAKQPLDLAAVVGLALILTGVVVINVFSRATGH